MNDAWTRQEDRGRSLYMVTIFIAGLAAPLFLFLAGLTLSMAASARASKVGHAAAASMARLRGLQVFALAFLFRLQSQLLGWGALINFLKVDILNVMGVAMIAAALLWGVSPHRLTRIVLFAIATIAVAMGTPLVREAGVLAALAGCRSRPTSGRCRAAPTSPCFHGRRFSWPAPSPASWCLRRKRLRRSGGCSSACCSRAWPASPWATLASLQPSIYPVANFWTSSPTFFFMRLGFCAAMLPIARGIDHFHAFARRRWSRYFSEPDVPGRVIATLGKSSLFVYWIHVEMAYGGLSRPLKRALPLELSLLAAVALCALLYQIVKWKDRKMGTVELTGPWRILAPVLK